MDRIDAAVIGAGVIGLAVARALAMDGMDVILIEKESSFGTETSARNSEVIHAGIYYPKGSLKAQMCVRGKQLLYDYLKERALPYKNCGKIIVACGHDEVATLEGIQARAAQNGVNDLEILSKEQVTDYEPEIRSFGGLYSPSTGIVDSHSYMLSLLGDFENNGGVLACHSLLKSGEVKSEGIVLNLESQGQEMSLQAGYVFNCAGLHADKVAQSISGIPKETIPKILYAKGNYFSLSKKTNFSHLIYPVPVAGGLGTHLTLDLAGQARFGPDVEWVDEIDYKVNEARKDEFISAISRYWPDIVKYDLSPDYAGIRPKITDSGEQDFYLQTPADHGVGGLYNFYGYESPGLTASLAVAEDLVRRVQDAAKAA